MSIADRLKGKAVMVCVDDVRDLGVVLDADDNGVLLTGSGGAHVATSVQRFYSWAKVTQISTLVPEKTTYE